MVDAVTGLKNLIRTLETIQPELRDTMQEAVEEAADAWVEAINTRGTDRKWRTAWRHRGTGEWRTHSGKARVETGKMRDSMRGEVSHVNPTEIVGVVGWRENSEPYMIYQDVGFTHNLTHEYIQGVQGKREAYEKGREVLMQGLTDLVKRL